MDVKGYSVGVDLSKFEYSDVDILRGGVSYSIDSIIDVKRKLDVKNQPTDFCDQFNFNYPDKVHIWNHPLLGWTEIDIWLYIKDQKIPIVDLYFSKSGKRYRSLGDKDITSPVNSNAKNLDEIISELKITKVSERSGRVMDHEQEDVFERLRTKGYM
mgnify:CR=1 FL=1